MQAADERFSSCRFHPWVGKHYETGPLGCRLLILGESHYNAKALVNEAAMTSEVIQRFALGKKPLRFFSVVARVVTGAPVTTEEARQTFWDSAAFYNYVQELAGTGPRQRPTEAMWAASKGPFAQVLEALRPQCMLILGQQLARNLPSPHDRFSLGEVDSERVMARSHHLADGTRILALTISHPSSGRLAYATWNPRVRFLLELASVGPSTTARQ